MIQDKDGVKIYIVSDIEDKSILVSDLEKNNKCIVISDRDSVLTIYGTIMSAYKQYNLYKVESLEDVDEEYINEIAEVNMTKEEAIMYVGKTLNEKIEEVIDRVECNQEDRLILSQVKEVMSGMSGDTKSKAEIEALSDENNRLREENKEIRYKMDLMMTENDGEVGNKLNLINTINTNNVVGKKAKIIYIRETSKLKYINTMILQYIRMLKNKFGIKVQLLIIDDKIQYRYKNVSRKIKSVEEYQSNRLQINKEEVVVMNGIYPFAILDLMKNNGYNYILIYDRICEEEIIKGDNVKRAVVIGGRDDYESYKDYIENIGKQKEEILFIGDNKVLEGKGVGIIEVEGEWEKEQVKYYIYSNMLNDGEDNRKIFDIMNEKFKIEEGINNVQV